MTDLWTSRAIADATGGTASSEFSVSSVDIDSRTIEPGGLFVAMPGTEHDGHAFIAKAQARGAAGFLVSDGTRVAGLPHVLVNNVVTALEALGQVARARTGAQIAAITGSAGKTSVKEVVRQALERYRPNYVHASVKSYNNHVGVPLTLARMADHVKFGIFEIGMNHAGEITDLVHQLRPHVAVITNVGTAHLENFKNEAGIAAAKAEIFTGLLPGGTAIIPHDSVHTDLLRDAAHAAGIQRIVSFGMATSAADVYVEKVARHASCSCVIARVGAEQLAYKINQPGDHWIANSLCVLATVQALGGDLGLCGLTLAELSGLAGRGQRVEISAPDGGMALLFDESYNANPASMAAALSVLGGYVPVARGRRIAVLADMKELGPRAPELHAALADAVIAADIKILIAVGDMMATLAQILPKSISVLLAPTAQAGYEMLHQTLRCDDLVLVKGSNSMGLSFVVAQLVAATAGVKE